MDHDTRKDRRRLHDFDQAWGTAGTGRRNKRSNAVQIWGIILTLRDRRTGEIQHAARCAAVNRWRPVLNLLSLTDLAILVGGFIVLKLFMRDSSLGGNVVVYMIFMVGFVGWKMYENA